MTSPRRTNGWILVALPAIGLAIAFCNSEDRSGQVPPSGSSGSGIGGTGGASASTASFVGNTVATSGAGGQGGGVGIPVADAGIPDGDVPPEPVVTCDPAVDAGDADICPLPPPTCAGLEWLIYYKNPECMDGLCRFEAFAYPCGPATSCINGACEYNFTL